MKQTNMLQGQPDAAMKTPDIKIIAKITPKNTGMSYTIGVRDMGMMTHRDGTKANIWWGWIEDHTGYVVADKFTPLGEAAAVAGAVAEFEVNRDKLL